MTQDEIDAKVESQEPVAIEYWLQETMESGRWVTTGNMSMATAKRILSDEDYCEVYPQGRIVGPSPPQRTEQEPVAWIHNFIEGGISIGKRPADLSRHPERWTALYKDPTPCQTCQALARTVMLDQTSHDTTPPQN